ncbi:hypothetical protein KQ306_08830 [Synechococcus sp. CS-1324]|uniref:hypothetical protein n=1 Tax=Synechococcus sp. CS-1324 TaxID=2847980 RepID=UPI00223C2AB8|nr:hypothetical protein [Synechococcus sp. CS-1324]MCT0230952.1 hypothetical protein [Synechococcus sp. CS-1324]
MTTQATRLLDAQTVLVGWINHSATDCYEHIRSSGEIINLGTDLETSASFVLVASHPGHSEAVTVTLELAPLLPDGNAGTWITAAAVAIPAAGGKVEATIAGHGLLPNPADAGSAEPPCIRLARALVSPTSPDGMLVALTASQGL